MANRLRTSVVVVLAAVAALAVTPHAHAVLRATQSDSAVYRSGIDDAGAARYFDLLDDVDADAQRISLRWGRIAQTCGALTTAQRRDPDAPGCYDWALIDQAVRGSVELPHAEDSAPAKAPREVYFSVREPPCWLFRQPACVGEAAGNSSVGASPGELGQFQAELEAFLTAAATRYSGRPGRQPLVRNWTVWNEPNGAFFWSERQGGSAAAGPDAAASGEPPVRIRACHYAHVYAGVVRALRANEQLPTLRFGFGPLAPSSAKQPVAFLEAALDVGAGAAPFTCGGGGPPLITADLVDALGVHPYSSAPHAAPSGPCASWVPGAPPTARSMSLQCIDRVRALIDSGAPRFASVAGKPMWALEVGYEDATADPVNGVATLTQAAWYPLVLERLADAGAEVVSWYAAVDGGEPADWQSGLVAANLWSRRPLALQFQAPLALRRDGPDGWVVWASGGSGASRLLISTRCDHAARGRLADGGDPRYAFKPLEHDPSAGVVIEQLSGGVRARLSTAPEEFCVARAASADAPHLGLVAGVRRVSGDATPYLVVPRVVDDVALDPRGDVVGSLGTGRNGNPTLGALLRRYLLGSPEPAAIDPTRRPLLAPLPVSPLDMPEASGALAPR